jgi:RHS repeat-associated protein
MPPRQATTASFIGVGNRLSVTTNGVPAAYTTDTANRLTAAEGTTFGNDATGNRTSASTGGVTTTYTFDALNQLTGLGGPATASYVSNGEGLRVAKTVGGVTTRYVWDLGAGLPVVLAEGTSTEYVYGHDLIGRIVTLGGQGTATYDAFGAVRMQTGVQLPFGFTGQQQDGESGLVYLRARFYDPTTGRFLSKDPVRGSLRRPASQHGYAYASHNPLRYRDPRGLMEDGVGPTNPDGQTAPLEPLPSHASIDPINNPGAGAVGPCFTPIIGNDCAGTGPVITNHSFRRRRCWSPGRRWRCCTGYRYGRRDWANGGACHDAGY